MTTPISDLGLLSDCQSAALASRDGTIVWWPSRRFDSPSAFRSLLDAHAGHRTIRPRGEAQASRRYCDGTQCPEPLDACDADRHDARLAVLERAPSASSPPRPLAAAAARSKTARTRSGQPLGNMPRAISHIGLVHAAVAITEARERQAVEA